MEPFLLILAPITSSPLSFSTGILSPVSIDSSTEVRPSTTTPSTGILSPGRTRITSPKATSSTVISCSTPLRITRAVLGAKLTNFSIAEDICPFERSSKNSPNVWSAKITPVTS